ncbi:magnesium-translocating P-type ATPase [Lactobacillus sp. LL6]|uniref:magnesium-translocating P-type ATPase n=1 Tax=Lactobacillus sp. LL6 TaxID=2596827 RepID=UPI0011855A1D|nr:magnesium-translocating P-type ATPase [Lactobacillus sp. LL6]TSO25750.1 magnesium-translocating P-type ATPase [Lactobacillus sp. LL6]
MLNVKTSKYEVSRDYIERVKKIARESRTETLARLHASAEGLSTKQAMVNREEYGTNQIVDTKNDSKWHFFIESFLTPFTIVLILLAATLLIADVVPSGQDDVSTAIIIVVMVLIAGIIKFVQNIKTSDAVEEMLALVSVTTNIKRDNENQELPTNEVVVGDVINLSAGDMVPADMRLLRSKDLFCSTSYIDGKFDPKEKIATKTPRFEQVNNYLDYPNIVYEGTTIVSGSGTGVVFATGKDTIFGKKIRDENKRELHKTTFNVGIKSITKLLMLMMVIVSALVFIINGITKANWISSFVFAIAIAAGLTPEMLPVIVTSNLVNGSKKMAKRGNIVKRLNSIQYFGSADVLCTDKTGILTQDKVMLERHYDLTMQETKRVLELSYLNAYYQTGMKDLIDEAVINAAGDELDTNEIQRDYNKIDEIPFDYNRRRMSVVVANSDQNHGEHLLVTKGAAEQMLEVATKVELNGKVLPLTKERREKILEQVEDLNTDGMRVLLLGYKRNPAPVGEFSVNDENDLTLVGFLTFLDPPKESAQASLAKLRRDGIDVKVLTGDNEAVTRTLGLQVGLNVNIIYSASDLEGKSTEELSKMVEECNIFVELTPELKTKIIKILRTNGHTVAYLGDKINDAPAMHASNVSISIDNAVDIAKESADIIMLNKDLAILEDGIRISRNVLGNIMKYFKVILTSSFGNSLAMIIASIFLPFLPMMPLQIVVMNLLFGMSCLLIPFDKMPKSYLDKPKKWAIRRLPKFMIIFGSVSTIIDIITFALLFFWICPQIAGGNFYEISKAQQIIFVTSFYTGWFIESIWIQEIVIHVIRDKRFPFIFQHATPPVIMGTLFAAIVGTILPFSFLSKDLAFGPMPQSFLLVILILLLGYVLLMSLVKILYLQKNDFLI